MLKIKRSVLVEPTPEELALAFAELHSDEQVKFFNTLAKDIDTWDKPFCFQLQAITDDPDLSPAARQVMQAIGEYAETDA